MTRITFTAEEQHEDIIEDVRQDTDAESTAGAVRECIERAAAMQQRDAELQQQIDDLQQENERLHRERRQLLEHGRPTLIHDGRRLTRSPTGRIYRATYHLPRAALQ